MFSTSLLLSYPAVNNIRLGAMKKNLQTLPTELKKKEKSGLLRQMNGIKLYPCVEIHQFLTLTPWLWGLLR